MDQISAPLPRHGVNPIDRAVGVEFSCIDALAASILAVAAPSDDVIAVVIHADVGVRLIADGGFINAELAALRGPVGIEGTCKNVGIAASGRTLPDDGEIAVGVGGNPRVHLSVHGRLVDENFASLCAVGMEDPCIHAFRAAVQAEIRPDRDNVAVFANGRAGEFLVSLGRGVDLEFGAGFRSGGIVALTENAPSAAVLAGARPRNDELAFGVHGDGGVHLVATGRTVDQLLIALGDAGRVEASEIDVVVIAFRPERLDQTTT